MPVFFDTNVLVYCTDAAAPKKQSIARQLVSREAAAGEAVLSTQVLIELFNALVRKQAMSAATAQSLIRAYGEWPTVTGDRGLVDAAIELSIGHQLSIWDAMVIAAALRAQCQTLYTEDLSHGRCFGTLTIVDPFRSQAPVRPAAR